MKKTIFAVSLVALLAAAPAVAQVDFTNYVALGDSMTAGFASASMMDWYQDRSFPAVLARQAGRVPANAQVQIDTVRFTSS